MRSYDKEAKLIRVEGSDVTYKAIVIQNASLPVATMEALQKLFARSVKGEFDL